MPSRLFSYTGLNFNVTCISAAVSGVVFTWGAVNDEERALTLPSIITSDKTSVLVYRPITFGAISVMFTCSINIPELTNIIANHFSTTITFSGRLHGFCNPFVANYNLIF